MGRVRNEDVVFKSYCNETNCSVPEKVIKNIFVAFLESFSFSSIILFIYLFII